MLLSLATLGLAALAALPAVSERTRVVGLEVDRDAARIVAFTVKPRPFVGEPAPPAPRASIEGAPVQIEVVLLGPASQQTIRRVDLAGLCLAHAAGTPPHVAGDTIRLHRESLVIELPELAGFDRIEVAVHEDAAGSLERRRLATLDLAPELYREVPAARTAAGSTPLWPEDFGDADVYHVFGNEAEGPRRINVVLVPDGYTYAEKSLLETHAAALVDYFRATRPYAEHDSFFNYVLVYAYSAQSGTDQCDCSIVADTAMGTRFPLDNPQCGHSDNRCLYYGGGCDASGEANIVEAELRAPFQDTTIVMVNTPRYGGCGGARAVYSAANEAATDVAVHELGHSLAGLADEYQGIPSCGLSAGEINTSRHADVGAWPEWIADIGAPRQGAEYFDLCVYRPLPTCEMRSLFTPFCPVCNQRWSLVTFGHARVNPTAPLASASPPSLLLAVEPWTTIDFAFEPRFSQGAVVTNQITWRWTKPGGLPAVVGSGTTSLSLTFSKEGLHTLALEVTADTNFVKPQKTGANRDARVWQIDVAATGPPAEVSAPGSTAPLQFTGPNRLVWEAPSASGATSFNLYGGSLSLIPAGGFGECLQSGLQTHQAVVFGQPAPGESTFYLVSGENSAGEGSIGSTSAGIPRVPATACP